MMAPRFYKIALAASLALNAVLALWIYLFSGLGDTLSLIQGAMGLVD